MNSDTLNAPPTAASVASGAGAFSPRALRSLLVFLLGAICGTVFGVLVGFFTFPFVFPPPVAMEQLAPEQRAHRISGGTFIHANPADPWLHAAHRQRCPPRAAVRQVAISEMARRWDGGITAPCSA
jgi:hypothetical protein